MSTIDDTAAYAELQRQMSALNATMDCDSEEWNKAFLLAFGKMEEIKNRHGGYAPGTEPKEVA